MNILSAISAPVPRYTSQATVQQPPVNQAVLAAQTVASTVRTQTAQAAVAAGQSEQPRDTKGRSQSGEALDTRAGALAAKANGTRGGGATAYRGTSVNIRV